ncbi:MAG: hypothetical protein ACREUE_04890 [Panacagrimonas sp.]
MIHPPFVPKRRTSIAPAPRRDGDPEARSRGGIASRNRFEYDFETLFAIRALQAQSLWYARLDLISMALGFLSAAGMLGALAGGETRIGALCAAALAATAVMQILLKPRKNWAGCNALRAAFVKLRARALEYDDVRYAGELRQLQGTDMPPVWNWLRFPICNELCAELGCWSDIRTARPWSERLVEKLP